MASTPVDETSTIPTPAEALAIRPTIEDPRRLTNGSAHPAYVEWLTEYSYADEHPFHTFLSTESRLARVTDARGYFDRKRVTKALGPSGPKMWLVRGSLPTRARVAALADLLDEPVHEVESVIANELDMRDKHEAMLRACRHLPYRLLDYEQTVAGVPCPGCGRPWVGERLDNVTEETLWSEAHGECGAGGHSLGDGPQHCIRCCGYPALNPETLAKVERIIADAMEAAERRRRAEVEATPAAREAQAEKKAKQRAKRIKALEAELDALRAEEEGDAHRTEES